MTSSIVFDTPRLLLHQHQVKTNTLLLHCSSTSLLCVVCQHAGHMCAWPCVVVI
jgi:hypothetical protein